MHKNMTRLEAVVGEKVFHLFCDIDSSIPLVKEALFQFLKYVGAVEDANKANQPPVDQPPVEQPQPAVEDANQPS